MGVERRRRRGAQLGRVEALLEVATQPGERFPLDGRVEQLRERPPAGPQTEPGAVVIGDRAAALADVVEGGEGGEVAAGPVGQRRRGERGGVGPVGGITCSGIGPTASGRDSGAVGQVDAGALRRRPRRRLSPTAAERRASTVTCRSVRASVGPSWRFGTHIMGDLAGGVETRDRGLEAPSHDGSTQVTSGLTEGQQVVLAQLDQPLPPLTPAPQPTNCRAG